MSDRYTQLVTNPIGEKIAGVVGLPVPTPLVRWSPGSPVLNGAALIGAAAGGRLAGPLASELKAIGIKAFTTPEEALRDASAAAELDAGVFNPEAPSDQRFKALLFDATGIKSASELVALHDFFHQAIRKLKSNGRVLVFGTAPESTKDVKEATAQRALEGFTRSLGKEARGASSVQLVYVAPGGETQMAGTLRFLLSPKSAYVSGQVVRIGKTTKPPVVDWDRPLDGKIALVTGASRGIGASIAATLARDGAHVVGLDIPQLADDLKAVTSALGGSHIEADVTAAEAPAAIAAALKKAHGKVDIVVHNAGITRDKTVAGMKRGQWEQVLDVNLVAAERITDALIDEGVLGKGGRIIGVSSMNGIAGAKGQTNYGASKAGLIGYVQAMAPVVGKAGITINAVAPGFIETQMTAEMPLGPREAGRRMNSLSQGGLPVDVAETIAWFASPGSGGVTGNIVRVCGQSLLGA